MMKALVYVVAATIGVALSWTGIGFAMLGGRKGAYVIGAGLLVAHIVSLLLAVRLHRQDNVQGAALALASPVLMLAGAIYVGNLLWLLGRLVVGS